MGFGKKDNLSQKDLYFKNDGINDKSRKRNYVLASIASILFIVFMFFNGVNLVKYVNAYVNYTTGNLDKSIVQFEELGDFLNAKYLVLDSKYLKAEKDFSKNPETSITVMNELNTDHGFKDSYSKYQQFVYEYASNSFEKGEYLKSAKWFNNSIGYKDSTAKVNESYYKLGKLYWEQKNYDSAITYIKLAGLANYKDSNALLSEYQYQYALMLLGRNDLSTAINYLSNAGDYKDSQILLVENRYKLATRFYNNAQHKDALDLFSLTSGYKDSDLKIAQLEEIVYKWSVTNSVAYESEKTRPTSTQYVMSRYAKGYDYAGTLVGGKPFESVYVKYVFNYPGGSVNKVSESKFSANSEISIGWSWDQTAPVGIYTYKIYIKRENEWILIDSIKFRVE